MAVKRKLILALSGASGSLYGENLINRLLVFSDQIQEIALIISPDAAKVWEYENDKGIPEDKLIIKYECNKMESPPASGSAGYSDMIICPCSMATLGKIAGGISDNLITRAADVILKERKRLIVVPREMPYNLIHIKNMETLTLAGGIICPASPSFYSKPQNIPDLVNTVTDKILSLCGFDDSLYRWGS